MTTRRLIFLVVFLLLIAGALGVYGWHLKSRADELARGADSRPVPVPVAGPTEPVTLVVAFDDDVALRRQSVSLPLPPDQQSRALEIERALLALYTARPSSHPLAEVSQILDVFLTPDGTAVINTNAAFADAHRSGVLGENLTTLSLVETLSANFPTVRRVKILVDDKERDTLAGHVDLKHFFEVERTHEAAQELSAAR